MTFVDQFGGKSAGELIRSELWNKLMTALDDLSTSVDTRFAAVDASLATLTTDVTSLTTDVTALQTDVAGIKTVLTDYFKVSLSTTRVSYATGEEAVIVAQLTDLHGQPVTFTADQRPWVDFVAVWGHLRAAAGFDSATGDSSGGERAISVRTNTSGQAQALLRAEVGPELPLQTHLDVSATMTSTLASKATLAQAILQAPTPIDAKNAGAFTALATEYDRPTATSMRSYVDTYYVRNAPAVIGKIAPPVVSPVWRDYASIVVAVARADADPTTPDHARGSGSIRVGFRDWIGPWLQFHYFDPIVLAPAISDIRTKLQPQFTADYFDSVSRLKNEVTTLVGPDRGLVGRIQDFQAIHGALDGITVNQPAALVQQVAQTMQQVVAFQQVLEPAQASTLSASEGKLGLDAVTGSAVSAATDVGAVKSQVASIQTTVDAVNAKVDTAHSTLSTLDGRVAEASSSLATITNSVQSVTNQVNKVQQLYPATVRDQILKLQGVLVDVQTLKKQVGQTP